MINTIGERLSFMLDCPVQSEARLVDGMATAVFFHALNDERVEELFYLKQETESRYRIQVKGPLARKIEWSTAKGKGGLLEVLLDASNEAGLKNIWFHRGARIPAAIRQEKQQNANAIGAPA